MINSKKVLLEALKKSGNKVIVKKTYLPTAKTFRKQAFIGDEQVHNQAVNHLPFPIGYSHIYGARVIKTFGSQERDEFRVVFEDVVAGRYCRRCGQHFEGTGRVCPECRGQQPHG